jgi:STE24 endopeptidase
MIRLQILIVFFLSAVSVGAVELHIPQAAIASAHFDAQAATDAWLATVSGPDRRRSDAYFEGGYWLILWDFLSLAAVMIVLLETRVSAKLRDLASRLSSRPWLRTYFYWIGFAVISAVLLFPLTVYEGFFREHVYGLSNQSFVSWMRDQLIAFALILLIGGLILIAVINLVRGYPRSWHIWSALVMLLFAMFGTAVAPVFIAPLFNTYTPLKNQRVKAQILSLAHANGIPVDDVYEVNASRQSKRVSANVSGLFGTDRITLNDNLLRRCSEQGVLATMGHEMGHYVMHHILNGMLFLAFILLVMFTLLRWGLLQALAMRGTHWQIAGLSDLAVLPLAVLLFSFFGFVLTPLTNTYTRMQEYAADIYGLNAARQPDGEAEVDLLLGEYRKLDPSPLEEFIFFDHPSGRTRIYAAMRWKKENLCLFDASLPCASGSDLYRRTISQRTRRSISNSRSFMGGRA